MDSGLDSVVTSAPSANPNADFTAPSNVLKPSPPSSDGVPPPTNTVSARGADPVEDEINPAALSSSAVIASSQDCGDADVPSSPAVYVLKSQYPQRVAQNGTWRYTPNGREPSPSKAAGRKTDVLTRLSVLAGWWHGASGLFPDFLRGIAVPDRFGSHDVAE
ncbi:hypothetical protein GCM10007304_16130 [Rhodococcoides trifolii]|uniref:Uncharacterized protein n=1 Tax=Rhodococcoides trifolii TaxID=908250 RepID=A0A917CZD8_9NOCA|nr:hypothetical protein GCM10007304_16130 [Rhodococcus trifolii]